MVPFAMRDPGELRRQSLLNFAAHRALLKDLPSEMPRRFDARTLAVPAILLATLLWGVSTSVAKLALDEWPPLAQAWFRFAVALVVLIPLCHLSRHRVALGRLPALLGFTGIALFYALHNLGLHATSAVNASLILDGGTPALTLGFGAILLDERPRRIPLIGLMTSLIGVGGVVLAAGPGGFGAVGQGDLLMLTSAALWGLYSVVGKVTLADQGVLPVITGSTIYGVLFLTPAALFEMSLVGPPRVTAQGTSLVLFLGLGCSALAYLLFGHALTHLSAWQVASWTTLMPLVGVVAAALLLREPILIAQIAGGALILLGVMMTSRRVPRPEGRDERVVWPSAPERKRAFSQPARDWAPSALERSGQDAPDELLLEDEADDQQLDHRQCHASPATCQSASIAFFVSRAAASASLAARSLTRWLNGSASTGPS
jgi:drug/metabolite transporter (DMT)-like permease